MAAQCSNLRFNIDTIVLFFIVWNRHNRLFAFCAKFGSFLFFVDSFIIRRAKFHSQNLIFISVRWLFGRQKEHVHVFFRHQQFTVDTFTWELANSQNRIVPFFSFNSGIVYAKTKVSYAEHGEHHFWYGGMKKKWVENAAEHRKFLIILFLKSSSHTHAAQS